MSPILTLFKREFLGYFRSPIAYVFLSLFLFFTMIVVWLWFRFFNSNDTTLTVLLYTVTALFVLFAPAAGMRLWSEEKRSGTWELLFTMPISVMDAVIAKFLAGWAFVALAVLSTGTMILTLAYLGEPDWGPVFTGYFGVVLASGAFMAVCSLASALTRNQVISFVIGAAACFLLIVTGLSIFDEMMNNLGFPVWVSDALSNFSFITHVDGMIKGIITLRDVVFFLSVMVVSLLLTVLVLER
jgi:ABC-2 type transport system permease protein